MTAQIGNTDNDERGLLPYPVIIAATKGDPEAMNIVVKHYRKANDRLPALRESR